MKRILSTAFIILFLGMLAVPIFTTNLQRDKISNSENRYLANFPSLYTEDGQKNKNFNIDFETWINDNIGMRSHFVVQNAKIQYYIFDVLSNNSDMVLGPKGEINYAPDFIIRSYQHFDLKDETTLQRLALAYQIVDEYTSEKGIQLYYYQCWDKHSIYPEYFPRTIVQRGDISKTDQIVKNLVENTNVNVVSPKEKLIEEKNNYETYSRWGDPTHWTDRGAYIGYVELMNEINKKNNDKYDILYESDYNISITDQGKTLFGGIHIEDYQELFEIKEPQAYLTNEKLTLYSNDKRHRFFTNESVTNKDRVLILGDSYFNSFIIDDLAESFYETLIIWGDYEDSLGDIIEAYTPDIIIVENAERCDRTNVFIDGAFAIKDEEIK